MCEVCDEEVYLCNPGGCWEELRPLSLFYDSVPESQEDVVAYLLFLFGRNNTIPLK